MTLYYVKNGGSDAADGLSDANAWETINKINISSFNAGDSVLFKKGSTWREQLTVPSSGSAGSPITFGAYGSGANPIISGAELASTWIADVGSDFTGDANLQAYWYLEEESGTRYDGTANDNDLTDNNTVLRTETHMQGTYAADFEENNSESLSRTNANLSASFPGKQNYAYPDVTMGCWINPETIPGAGVQDVFMGTYDRLTLEMRGNSSGKFVFGIKDDGGTYVTATANSAPSTGNWYHVVGRWKGSTNDEMSIFVNGVKQTDTNTSVDAGDVTGAYGWALGNAAGLSRYTDCILDECFIFNSALTDDQILSIYQNRLDGSAGGMANVYKKTGMTNTVYRVIEDGVELAEVALKADLSAGEWWYDSVNDILYVYCTDGADPDTHTMEVVDAGNLYWGIDSNDQSYIALENLEIVYATGEYNVYIDSNSTYWTLTDLDVHDSCAGHGLRIEGDNTTIIRGSYYKNGLRDQDESGISIWTTALNTLIDEVTVYDNCEDGIIDAGTNTIIRGCHIYNQQNPSASGSPDGIQTGGNASGFLYFGNRIHDIKNGCITLISSGGGTVAYNLVYNSASGGISIYGNGNTGTFNIYNNVGYDAADHVFLIGGGATTNLTMVNAKNNIWVAATGDNEAFSFASGENAAKITLDNNLYYDEDVGNVIDWLGTPYTTATFEDYKIASGKDTNSISSDPLFINPGTDFHLQATSPCINAGVDVGLTQDYEGNTVPSGKIPDIGAYEYYMGGVKFSRSRRRSGVYGRPF